MTGGCPFILPDFTKKEKLIVKEKNVAPSEWRYHFGPRSETCKIVVSMKPDVGQKQGQDGWGN